jgi:hypothetical protein
VIGVGQTDAPLSEDRRLSLRKSSTPSSS